MPDTLTPPRARLVTSSILTLSLGVFALQALVVRPHLWPAGAGMTVSGDTVFASLSEPRAIPRIRPPHLDDPAEPFHVTRVAEGGPAAQAGITVGTPVHAPDDVAAALLVWRDRYRQGPGATVTLTEADTGRTFTWAPQPVWRGDAQTRADWMREHAGALAQMAAFLAGAIILVALGTRGMTATLMTLALIFTAIANGGPLFGAELQLPLAGPLVLLFAWAATAASFPIIGLAVLHFPSRAPVLARHPWIYAALSALPLPVLAVSLVAAAFLLGMDAALAPLSWFSTNGWLFDASFAAALGANVAIVVEGIHRYRTNLDLTERRRIQIVVYTGVPAVFAYALKTGIPLVTSLAGRPVELPWLIEAMLQGVVLLPAFALPYAVAVRHVFSPRTVLRRGLQYALARRTLSVLIVLPVAALAVSFVTQRDRPLGDIILGQPLFYAFSLGLLALGLKYRDGAQRALDRRFFRAEYDAREILIALANRVPYETDPAQLVRLVMSQIDDALHPESVAVLAGEDGALDVVASTREGVQPLSRDSGLVTLLRWSEEPLEIFLDEDRSPATRLPAADREWLAASGLSLLVPVLNGTGEHREVVGVIALGAKRSEEPYTPEDRKLLGGIAAQISIALDLSRLRKRASDVARNGTPAPTLIAPTARAGAESLGMCPTCRRCYDLSAVRRTDSTARCPDDDTVLQAVVGMPPVVDGKYRVDAAIGRGGMGAVFRARDLRLERDVALKVVRAELLADPDARTRFQREAQIVARLQHPAIVTVFDYGALPDGAAFLVMEFVRGEDVRHLLRRETRLAAPRAVDLVAGVAAGVDAAHRAGVLHRDLKPENVLLPASGTGPKVVDFGVAKLTAGEAAPALATQGATIVGTPAYMAPEQLRGEVVDGRADVYSLAVLTYEVLTGRLPFGQGAWIDLALRQADGAAIDFDGVPGALAAPIRRALSPEREARPATAAAFAEELKLLL